MFKLISEISYAKLYLKFKALILSHIGYHPLPPLQQRKKPLKLPR
jgi:hypothetical protein